MSPTVVFLHAHPDDEALLTGGTMALLAAAGCRVVLITATSGELGLAAGRFGGGELLSGVRRAELGRAAEILGCRRTELLGYADSGYDPSGSAAGNPSPTEEGFADVDVAVAAAKVAQLLREERADALVGYDAAGGYGHRDHVQVHRVARRAAELAATPLLLEATVDRRALQRAVRLAGWSRPSTPELRAARYDRLFSAHEDITHRVDVRPFVQRKRAAMQAHASQATADGADRMLAWFLRLPRPVFGLVFGHEWFVEVGPARVGDVLPALVQ
jgi:LmbE family N-acetylglucosaminyl deacetylase